MGITPDCVTASGLQIVWQAKRKQKDTENAARAVRGPAATPWVSNPIGTYLPRYLAPLVPTSLGTSPVGLGT